MRGILHVVATPIGHLSDASPRLDETLRRCALLLCEDTRRTGRLLELLGIPARGRLVRCDAHAEARRVPLVLEALGRGEEVALLSDAGTPGLSDPGARVVRAVHEAGHSVSPVPGPSAITAALSCSGMPADAFTFEGFLPRKRAARRRLLAALADEARTMVLLETPHRLAESLEDLAEILGGDRAAFLGRELTKLHEEARRATLGELRDDVARAAPRGEAVLVVAGAPPRVEPGSREDLLAEVEQRVADGEGEKEALRAVARARGLSRREVYGLLKIRPIRRARDDDE